MSDMYEDFGGSQDDIAENDDDIGALGSILSWDDDEENARTSLTASSVAKDRETNGSAPPDMVQFNNGEFNFLQYGGLNASHLKALSSTLSATSSDVDAMGNMQQRITLQLPLPTPVSALGQAGPAMGDSQQVSQPQHKQQLPQHAQQQPAAGNFVLPQGPLMNQLAQLLAQQASNMMQQQQQQQAGNTAQPLQRAQGLTRTGSHPQVSQQLLPTPVPTNPQAQQAAQLTQQQQAMLQRIATMQQQAVAQQQQQAAAAQLQAAAVQHHQQQQQQQAVAQQQQQQQQQAVAQAQQQMTNEQQRQLSQLQASVAQAQQASAAQQRQPQQLQFSADPNALLQQLQFAQLQQQFQAAQAHASSQAMAATQSMKPPQGTVAPNASGSVSVPSDVQEQLKVHFNRAQNQQGAIAPTPLLPRSSDVATLQPSRKMKSASRDGGLKPAARMKSPPSAALPKVPRTTALVVSSVELASSSGLITASDTDGEVSRKAKKSKIYEAERSDSPLFDDYDDDDDDDEPVSAEAKAKSNRDRNREHARNTRLRKKAYLEKLKTTVDELCRERDTLVSERAGAANLLVEMHNTRTEVLMSLFALRSTNEKRRDLWSSILDESCFSCVMPVTPYRSFPASEVQVSKCQRTVMGIDGMIADTSSLHVLFDSLVDRSKCPLGKIEFRFTLITEEAVVAGNQMMARWTMSTVNAVQCGVKMEVSKQGMLCCRFNSGHKITGLELMFDVMAFMLQLKQAAGTETFSVIPNTVQTCQRTFEKPVVMTLAEPPYTIIQVNSEWEKMTGYTAEEVVGKANSGILQGSCTDRKAVDDMMHEIRFKRPFSTILMNVKKSGEEFRNFLLLFPLSTDSRVTHYLAITDYMDHPRSSALSQLPASVLVAQLKAKHESKFGQIEGPAEVNLLPTAATNGQRSGIGCPEAFDAMPPPPPTLGSKSSSEACKRPHESI